MAGFSGWDVALMVIGAFVAVTALVRLMVNRRDQILDELSQTSKRPKKKPTGTKTTSSADHK
jgi:hypothetical protein